MQYDSVKDFEQTIAEYAGAKYGVAVESCTAAILLSLHFCIGATDEVSIPKYTYPSVAHSIRNLGYKIKFLDKKWKGIYKLSPLPIIDSALRFKKRMYIKDTLYCLSFHIKKNLPIDRGGMILTDNKFAVDWLKEARWDGRHEGVPLDKDNATICGWNFYMTPVQAARGLMWFDMIKDKDLPDLKVEEQHYPDLSKWRCFR